MGDDTLGFLNGLAFPLSDELEGTIGELQRFTPTIDALVVPDIDAALDDEPSKTAFWTRSGARPLVGRAAAVLTYGVKR